MNGNKNHCLFFLLSVWLFMACNPGKQESESRIRFENNTYVLDAGKSQMTVSAETGGRILSFKYSTGEKWHEFLTPESVHAENYGATLWPSPQKVWDWPPSVILDLQPYEVIASEDYLHIKSKPDPEWGYQFEKRFQPYPEEDAIGIRYTIRNISTEEKNVSAWDVVRTEGDISFFPQGEMASLPTSNLKGLCPQEGILWYDFDKENIKEWQKMFSTAREGWLAHRMNGLIFIKTFPDITVAQLPPTQGEVEIFAHEAGGYIELENHGVYTRLAAGEELHYEQKWYIIPCPETEDRSVWVEAVRRIVFNQSE